MPCISFQIDLCLCLTKKKLVYSDHHQVSLPKPDTMIQSEFYVPSFNLCIMCFNILHQY